MKFFKNIFGSKQKKIFKNEPNTLAEANESPDMRLATTKEREENIPVIKSEPVKKTPKKTDTTKTKSTVGEATQSKSDAEKVPAQKNKPTDTKSPATTKNTKQKSTDNVSDEAKTTVTPTTKKATEKRSAVKSQNSISDKKADEKQAKSAETSEKKKSSTAKSNSTDATKSTAKSSEETATNVAVATESKSTRTGKFEIKKSKDGRFVFNLYASNNVIVATSQIYSSSTSAMNGIKSVIANAPTAPIEDQTLKNVTAVPFPKWEIYLDKGEQYRFRLCASNGSCVCHSQGYTTKTNCKKGIESIIKFAADAEITKVYLEKSEK